MSSQASNAAGGTKLTKFTVFNHLPPEIRIMIWKEYIRLPRIVHHDLGGRVRPGLKIKIDGFTRQQVPPALFVNRECRYVAMKSLLLFRLRNNETALSSSQPICNYAISSSDTLFFTGDLTSIEPDRWETEGDTSKIANIIISYRESHTPNDISWRRRDKLNAICRLLADMGHCIIEILGNADAVASLEYMGLSPGFWCDSCKLKDIFAKEMVCNDILRFPRAPRLAVRVAQLSGAPTIQALRETIQGQPILSTSAARVEKIYCRAAQRRGLLRTNEIAG